MARSGFRLTKNGTYWNGTWGKHIKCFTFAEIKSFQKVNHFPGSFHLGRKDKLWQNVRRLWRQGGQVPLIPETFLLPQDLGALREAWCREGSSHCWIVKPPASARGAGVHVVHKWAQIPKKQPLIVQRYIKAPFLINGTKFDLRLYALVTSFDPLKVYLFRDGLVRFASMKYSQDSEDLADRYVHLTNYSINKKSATYASSTTGDSCDGHKWSVKTLQRYLEDLGVDFEGIWMQMVDIIIKTLVCCEGPMNRLISKHISSRYTAYELFGFDILLDEHLKAWLLEVNISPSLRSATPVDHAVKSQVVKDMLNIVGFQVPQMLKMSFDSTLLALYGLEEEDVTMNHSLHAWNLSPEEIQKHEQYEAASQAEGILDELTPDDVRVLVQSEDEFSRRGAFDRILPCATGPPLAELTPRRRYYNLLLDQWERRHCHDRRKGIAHLQNLCLKDLHLTVPQNTLAVDCQSSAPDMCQKKKVARNVSILMQKRQHRG